MCVCELRVPPREGRRFRGACLPAWGRGRVQAVTPTILSMSKGLTVLALITFLGAFFLSNSGLQLFISHLFICSFFLREPLDLWHGRG